eukprot:TRINITY_DN1568_c2_g2_i6.p1 TRINITY_DN1568_c2_g2~~TRINITY_DN1568_c2_g2_i6.p1  ORF type:complete len:162 (+),score=21.87 TRINITY_DN1568_c2_g2_i6:567-1052(+)
MRMGGSSSERAPGGGLVRWRAWAGVCCCCCCCCCCRGAGGQLREESSAGILKIVQGVPVLPGDLAAVLALRVPPPVRSSQGRKRKFGDPRQQQQQDKMTAGQREGEGEGEGEVLRCAACTTSNTPEWRRGAGGVRLCNACGLQWLRVVREARAAGGSARQP